MKVRLALFLQVLVSLSAIATAQTPPSDLCSLVPNCVTGAAVPDIVAARMVIHSFSLPSTATSTDTQNTQASISAAASLTADDAAVVEQAIDNGLNGNFQGNYVALFNSVQSGTISVSQYQIQRDALVTSIENNVQSQISADGWSRLTTFVASQKNQIEHAQNGDQTTYQTPYEIGGPGDFGGEDTLFGEGGSDGLCTTNLSGPWMTAFGGTSYGTVKGYLAQVSRTKNPMQPNIVNNGTEGVTFTLSCANGFYQIIHLNFAFEIEIATSFLLNIGPAGDEIYWALTKLYYPGYKVTPSCSNVAVVNWPRIDYLPNEVYDDVNPTAWSASAACARFINPGQKWNCFGIPGSATPSTQHGGYCSYNP